MKVTKELHQIALKATHLERKCSSDLQRLNLPNYEEETGEQMKDLKNLLNLNRRISMGNNLINSNLIQDINDNNKRYSKNLFSDKSNDKLNLVELPSRSYGSIESLHSNEIKCCNTPLLDNSNL